MINNWKSYILGSIKTTLAPFGFRRSGQIFERNFGEVRQFVAFSFQLFEDTTYAVAPELAVSSSVLNRWMYGDLFPKFDWIQSEIRLDLAIIVPRTQFQHVQRYGLEWLISDEQSVASVLSAISERLEQHGIPFLDRLTTRDDIVQILSIRKITAPMGTWFSPGLPTVTSDYLVDCHLGRVDPTKVSADAYREEVFQREPHRRGKVTVMTLDERFPNQP